MMAIADKAQETKTVTARNNDPVFTREGTGHYTASLCGYKVKMVRIKHDEWVCIDTDTDDILGEGPTRNKAMKDAFYKVQREETKRLDWVLIDQPYRRYTEPRKLNRRRKVEEPAAEEKHEEPEEPQKEPETSNEEETETTAQIAPEKLRRLLTKSVMAAIRKHYAIKYNERFGYFWSRIGDNGELDNLQGPFDSELMTFENILLEEEII